MTAKWRFKPAHDVESQRGFLTSRRRVHQSDRCIMSKNNILTFNWTVVLTTVARATYMCELQGSTLSFADIENIVRIAAVEHGATTEILAILLRSLPKLLYDVQFADFRATAAPISLPLTRRYEIWTGGQHRVVEDISEYEDRKDSFSFWVDITNKKAVSLGQAKKCLKPTALRLLLFLSEHIATSVSCRKAFEHITGKRPEEHQGWKGLLNVYLTQLQNFAEDDFRKLYLVADRVTDTLSLSQSFRDKYFVFLTLSSTQN
jgi:hypothetical protein